MNDRQLIARENNKTRIKIINFFSEYQAVIFNRKKFKNIKSQKIIA